MTDARQWVLEEISERTDPNPDSEQGVSGDLWTAKDRLVQHAGKFSTPVQKPPVEDALQQLIDEREVLYWHGHLTRATVPYLNAVVQSEQQASVSRQMLVDKCRRWWDSKAGKQPVTDGGQPTELPEHPLMLGKRWSDKAEENIERWGNHRHDLLLLALIEEVGEIAMAMESHCGPGGGLPPNAVPYDQPEVVGRDLIGEMAALGRQTRAFLEDEFPEPAGRGDDGRENIAIAGDPKDSEPIIDEVEDAAPLCFQLYWALNGTAQRGSDDEPVTDGGRDTFECDDCGDETPTEQRRRYLPPGQEDSEVDFADLCPQCSTGKDSTRLFRSADDQEGR